MHISRGDWPFLQLLDLCHLELGSAIQHTIVYHSLTSVYISNFVQIGKLFVDRRIYVWAGGRTVRRWPALLGQFAGVDLTRSTAICVVTCITSRYYIHLQHPISTL